MKVVEVTPYAAWWAVKYQGQSNNDSLHDTKEQAITAGIKLAHSAMGQLLVRKQDGRFQIEWTYGKDPYPPKG